MNSIQIAEMSVPEKLQLMQEKPAGRRFYFGYGFTPLQYRREGALFNQIPLSGMPLDD